MKRHYITTNKLLYPVHHVWVTAKKINVISNRPIDVGDRVIVGSGRSVNVLAVDKPQEITEVVAQSVSNLTKHARFYELIVE